MKIAQYKKKMGAHSRFIALAVICTWFIVAAIGTTYFSKLSELSSTDLATFVPQNADSSLVSREVKFFSDRGGTPLVIVFDRDGSDLSNSDIASIDRILAPLSDIEGVSTSGSSAIVSEDKKAAIAVINLGSGADFQDLFSQIDKKLTTSQLAVNYTFTGAASFSKDLQGAFSNIDSTLLIVAISCVFIILLFIYRSPFLPILVIVSAVSALCVAVIGAYTIVNEGFVQLNGQVQGILFILVIGAAADYSLLYISRYREQLLINKSSLKAALSAMHASLPSIMAAGGTVSAGLLCLLASDLGSNKALGPIGTIGILLSVLSAVTLLPALLIAFGRNAFWPRIPHFNAKKSLESYQKQHRFWTIIAKFISKFPRVTWMACVVLLLAASLNIVYLKADGIPQTDILIGESDARNGQIIIDRHFPAGSGSPAVIILPKKEMSNVVSILDADPNVASVNVAAAVPQGSIPIGSSETKLRSQIKEDVRLKQQEQIDAIRDDLSARFSGLPKSVIEQEVMKISSSMPSLDSITMANYPFSQDSIKVINDKVLLFATLDLQADSVAARNTIQELRETFAVSGVNAMIGGVSATQLDTSLASQHDIRFIIPLILGAITLILMLLLRAVVAPLLLLGSTILSFTATMGVAAFFFNNVWNFAGADPTVIIIAFVFLVALGIDYNIFLMTRVREETLLNGVKKGTLKGLIVTGGVITGAGIVLAATFAALNIIPVVYLVEIAFIVSFGILLDTLIVRSLLVPAITLDIGPKMWWPSKISKRKK